jgi:hypothetical protein
VLSGSQITLPPELAGASRQFTFGRARIEPGGEVVLPYVLGNGIDLSERITIPLAAPLSDERIAELMPLVDLLHRVAGVSYYKAAPAERLVFEADPPGPAASALITALYSEGLGEFAFVNDLPELPRPAFESAPVEGLAGDPPAPDANGPSLVCIGGGKDSLVALAAAQKAGRPVTLFSVGKAGPIAATAEVSGAPHLVATRRLDPRLFELNELGALNGHVPVTAIVSLIAALTAAANGFGRVIMANERSASVGNTARYGIDVNHQFSKGERCEQLLRDALGEATAGVDYFSILRGASELLIARAFAKMTAYHPVFTSCNAVFRIDESRRAGGWCGECPKCRFVFLVLAPFIERAELTAIFGRDLLDDDAWYGEFARLAEVDGFKPFECVGEASEALAAFALLAADPEWSQAAVVRRFAEQVLGGRAEPPDPARELTWRAAPAIPPEFEAAVREVLGA